MYKSIRYFSIVAASVLTITAIAKIISIFSTAPLMQMQDPLLGISFRYLLLLAGVVELVVASICFLTKNVQRNVLLIAWLSTLFLAYRGGLWLIHWHRPCHCLGHLTELLHMRPEAADAMMRGILVFLLVGSYAGSIWLLSQGRKTDEFTIPQGTDLTPQSL